LTDVGDEQSLAKNLSTFSAHITNVVRILEAAGDGALVLLDEVATGTDPLEGGALACSIVEDLVEAGAAVAVTTHYESLKALATRHPKLENAAVGFDADAMRPTFVLARGVPGASSALDIAQRFGMPARIVNRARTVLPEEARTFEALVRELHEMKTTAAHERASASEERGQLERERAKIAAEMHKLAAKDREALDSAARKLRAEVTEARDRVKAVRTKLKQETLEAAEIGAIKRELDRATEIVAAARTEVEGNAAEERARVDPSAIGVGDVVWVERLRTRATVLERVDGARVRVAAGAMKLAVDVAELSAVATEPREPKRPKPVLESRSSPRSRDNSLDVRGLRVDEAVSLVSSFLDRLYGAAEATGYILHGHGTGALRDAIRKHLESEKDYVSKIRAASRDEGGEAVTVVELR
jgi:DNA mismatch repair protein MutS2